MCLESLAKSVRFKEGAAKSQLRTVAIGQPLVHLVVRVELGYISRVGEGSFLFFWWKRQQE